MDDPHIVRFGTPIDQIRVGSNWKNTHTEFNWTPGLRKLADQFNGLIHRSCDVPRALGAVTLQII
jgi:hypothetical protein